MTVRLPRLIVSGVVASAVLAFALGAAVQSRPIISEHTTNATSSSPVIVSLGDSIMEGHGLDPAEAWPAILAKRNGWHLTNFASDGSGFVTVGDNGDTFASQLKVAEKLHPSVVILSGSSNDLGVDQAKLDTATLNTIRKLHSDMPSAKIVAVSAVWSDGALPQQMNVINADVAAAVASVGGEFLDIGQPMSERADLMQSDDVHPTADGQEALARAVTEAMADKHLTLP